VRRGRRYLEEEAGEARRVTETLERLLTATELADLVGFKAGTIVDWSERGEIPSFKLGGRLRFRESEVVAWLEERRQRPDAGGDVRATPGPRPTRGVVSHLRATPNLGGDDG
jgi:excisionase family DNA binding protein